MRREAQAQTIAPTTAHAERGVSRPRITPIPACLVSATVTMRAPSVGEIPAAGFHETGGGAEVERLDQPRLDHRGPDADAENQQAEVGGRRGHWGVFDGGHVAERRGL